METSHPPIPFDPQGLVALHCLSAHGSGSKGQGAGNGASVEASRPDAACLAANCADPGDDPCLMGVANLLLQLTSGCMLRARVLGHHAVYFHLLKKRLTHGNPIP